MDTKKEREWIVRVYRRSARENDDRSGSGASGGWNRLVAKNGKGKRVAVRAVARRGFIVLPKIRSRICLSKSGGETKRVFEEGDDGHGHGRGHGSTALVQLQRRGDAILVRGRGRGRSRTLLLRFRSEQECLDFSDHLVALNRPPASASFKVQQAKIESTRQRMPHVHDAFRRNEERALVASTTETAAADDDLDVEEVAAYLARLLCDPEFDSLVHGLEACVASRPDLQAMLEAKAQEGCGKS